MTGFLKFIPFLICIALLGRWISLANEKIDGVEKEIIRMQERYGQQATSSRCNFDHSGD